MRLKPIEPTTRRQWAERITALYTSAVESIIKTGHALIAAKEALQHGEFVKMCKSELPFKERTAQKFMSIARHPALSNTSNWTHLPAAWTTLYELSTFEPEFVDHLIERYGKRLKEKSLAEILIEKDMIAMLMRPEEGPPPPASNEPSSRASLSVVAPPEPPPAPPETPEPVPASSHEQSETAGPQFDPVPDGEIAFPESAARSSTPRMATAKYREVAPQAAPRGLANLRTAWDEASPEARKQFMDEKGLASLKD